MKLLIGALAILLVVAISWLFRFEINSNGDQAYILDRWNGSVQHCIQTICKPTEKDGPWNKYKKQISN